jgi:AAA15 family ATPase/GTPase
MYTSFEIENFRCFNRLKVDKLARINLITGKNNSGKTSLLEALWLHAAPNNPMLTLRLNHIRGIKEGDYNSEELWGWLFHKKQTCRPAVLRGTESDSEPDDRQAHVGSA